MPKKKASKNQPISSGRKRISKRYTKGRENKEQRKQYLDYGFFTEYTPQQMKDNLFFVFQAGAKDISKIKFDEGLVERAEASARKAVESAYKASVLVESGFIKEFSNNFKKDENVQQAVGNLLQSFGVLDIFNKDGEYSEDEIKRFYNSPIFNFSKSVTGSFTDKSQYSENADDADFYYQKIHDMALGLRNAVSKEKNRQLAYEKLKAKFEEYLKGEQGENVVTGSNGLGKMLGDLGLNLIGSDLEEQMLEQFLDEILNVKESNTADMVESILKKDKNAINFKAVNQSNQVFGAFDEYLRAYVTQLLQGTIKTIGGETITISSAAVGKELWNTSSTFSTRPGKGKNDNLAGRTDVRIMFNFNKDHKHNYKINISNKMNKGFSQATSESGRQKSWILKNPDKAKTVKVYGGGELNMALDRILSSSLMSNGIMTEDDYFDIVYLLINGAQGGIYEKERSTTIKIYKAIASFCAIDEMYSDQGFGDNLFNGQMDLSLLDNGLNPVVVNLFVINGQYIPASQYFKAVLDLMEQIKKQAYVNTSITFADTFPEANYKTDTFMLGYLDYIEDNGLNYSSKLKGDPYKVSGNIMSKTKVGSYYMIWNRLSKQFWSSF